MAKLTKNVLIVPDTHFPWADYFGLSEMMKFAGLHSWDLIIQLGDAIDQYSWSRFSRDMSLTTPANELARAMEDYQSMWAGLKRLAPDARYVQLLGNHDVRIIKQAQAKYPEVESVLSALGFYEKVYGVEGVELVDNQRTIFRYDGVAYHHGDFLRTMVPGKRAQHLGESVVFGHTHRQWLVNLPDAGGIFELNAGALSDTNAKPLQYTSTDKPWQVEGWACILDGRPQIVRL